MWPGAPPRPRPCNPGKLPDCLTAAAAARCVAAAAAAAGAPDVATKFGIRKAVADAIGVAVADAIALGVADAIGVAVADAIGVDPPPLL